MTRELLCIGHRGARGYAPENTLLSIDSAIQMGLPWLEVDVQLHPSGELVLLHDLRVDRTTNGKGRLADLPFNILRGLDAGQGQQIPTLDEALDLVEQRCGVNLELKTWNGCAAAVAQVLRERIADGWPADKFLVSSFHLPELWEFKQLLPEVPIGVLYCGVPLDWAGIASELEAGVISVADEFVDPKLIADAHERGIKLYVYTVNHPEEIARMRELGVDGVFSDFPDRVLG